MTASAHFKSARSDKDQRIVVTQPAAGFLYDLVLRAKVRTCMVVMVFDNPRLHCYTCFKHICMACGCERGIVRMCVSEDVAMHILQIDADPRDVYDVLIDPSKQKASGWWLLHPNCCTDVLTHQQRQQQQRQQQQQEVPGESVCKCLEHVPDQPMISDGSRSPPSF